MPSKQAYQAFLDGIYRPGGVVVTAGDNDSTNLSGAVRHRFEDGGFGFFTSELEARLTRLGGAFPDGPGRTELLTKAPGTWPSRRTPPEHGASLPPTIFSPASRPSSPRSRCRSGKRSPHSFPADRGRRSEVLIGLWESRDGYSRERGEPFEYFYAAAYYRSTDLLRKQYRRRVFPTSGDVLNTLMESSAARPDGMRVPVAPEQDIDSSPLPKIGSDADATLHSGLDERLGRFVRGLSHRDRAILQAYLEGITDAELAAELDLTPGNVRVLRFRLFKRLRGLQPGR